MKNLCVWYIVKSIRGTVHVCILSVGVSSHSSFAHCVLSSFPLLFV